VSPALPGVDTLGDLAGKRVLIRSDLNVPLEYIAGSSGRPSDRSTRITDDGRIRASAPQINELLAAGASVVVCAHLGRPKGMPEPKYSLAPVATRLGEVLGRDVEFLPSIDVAPSTNLALLENVRFNAGETSKDDAERGAFADQLADFADVYVDDAFGAVHRKHASVYDVALRVPHAAGQLVQREVEVLHQLVGSPQRPYVVVLGGSKVSDKLAVIEHLLPRVDKLLVGGGMCFTFLAAEGHDVGGSLLEEDHVAKCGELLRTGKIELPVDIVVAMDVADDADTSVVAAGAIPADQKGLDIGPSSVERFAAALGDARTVFWNGPMGVFELAPFAAGTRGVAQAIGALDNALTVVGGGDSAAAVRALGIDEGAFSHISTGGGASLEYLEGKSLPGLEVLEH
jgi:phosphoglycerate kinase